jgi:hypothetical protein
MDPVAPSRETEEPITVTRTEIIYGRRVRVLEHGGIVKTCGSGFSVDHAAAS